MSHLTAAFQIDTAFDQANKPAVLSSQPLPVAVCMHSNQDGGRP